MSPRVELRDVDPPRPGGVSTLPPLGPQRHALALIGVVWFAVSVAVVVRWCGLSGVHAPTTKIGSDVMADWRPIALWGYSGSSALPRWWPSCGIA